MTRPNETQELISLLIVKQLMGTITGEEQQTLDEWRQQNAHNEAAYQRLMDTDRQSVEYRRSRMTDYRRPLADMKRRLSAAMAEQAAGGDVSEPEAVSHGFRIAGSKYFYLAAAALLFLVGSVIFYRGYQHMQQETEQAQVAQADIQPGRTQAVLTLDNGETVELGADETLNTRAIAQVQQKAATQHAAPNTLTTPRGGEFKVTLEDGTEVWLNAQTTLRYPETFDGDERRVEVSGEAYFKVAKNAEKPFYVVSGGQEVRVYGTEFNVHAYNDEPTIFTTLVEGSISLRPLNGNKSELMLTPGNQSVFTRGDASARVRKVDTEVVTSWRHGVFVFEDQNLEQIMRTLSRWYNFEYEFADAKVAQTEFMGSIPRYGSFNEVIDIFKKMGGIHLTLQGTKVLISAK